MCYSAVSVVRTVSVAPAAIAHVVAEEEVRKYFFTTLRTRIIKGGSLHASSNGPCESCEPESTESLARRRGRQNASMQPMPVKRNKVNAVTPESDNTESLRATTTKRGNLSQESVYQ